MYEKIKFDELTRLLVRAEEVVQEAAGTLADPLRTGGYFAIATPTGRILMVAQIGQIEESLRAETYLTCCMEKAIRLGLRREHLSSWQSRVEADAKYGGAIRTAEYILSFSGLPEKWDEACMVKVACREKLTLSGADFQAIQSYSRNELFAMNGTKNKGFVSYWHS